VSHHSVEHAEVVVAVDLVLEQDHCEEWHNNRHDRLFAHPNTPLSQLGLRREVERSLLVEEVRDLDADDDSD